MIRLTIPFSVRLSFKNPCSLWASVEERHRVLSELGCGVSVCTLIRSEGGTTTCSAVLHFNQNFTFPAGFENVAVELHYAENSPGYRLIRDVNCLSAVNENLIGSVSTLFKKRLGFVCLILSWTGCFFLSEDESDVIQWIWTVNVKCCCKCALCCIWWFMSKWLKCFIINYNKWRLKDAQ